MLLRSVLIALRQLRKHPITGFLNIAGLAIGITTFTLLFFYLKKENSYDMHFRHADQLYRVVNKYRVEKDENTTAWTTAALVTNLQGQVPEITEAIRLFRYRSPLVMVDRTANRSFTEENSIWADANVFRVFDIEFISGDPAKALVRPGTMAITESKAKKYFGDTDPIGRVLSDLTMGADFEITAVIRDLPVNTHFKADFICSLSTLPPLWGNEIMNNWGNSFLYTYLRLNDASSAGHVNTTLNEIAHKHIPVSENAAFHFALQPVRDIHLHSNLLNEWQPNSDIRYVYILAAVAVLILLVSAINYVNLWIARSEKRTREIGIRQAIGGSKVNLGFQFTIESLTYVVLALLLSIGLVTAGTPLLSGLMGEELFMAGEGSVFTWLWISLGMLAFMLIVMLYPSRIISRTSPALAIKGNPVGSRGGINLWESLITFQILVTTCLITGTLLINKQLSFIRDQPLGYDVHHLINIAQVSDTRLREQLKNELMRNEKILSVSGVSHLVGGTLYQSGYEINTGDKKEIVLWQRIHTDYDFCETYQIPIVAGRNFSDDVTTDTDNFMINETAARQLGLKHAEDAIGLEISSGAPVSGRIIGVMKDFHFKTLHTAIEPMIIHIVPDRIRMLTVNVGESDRMETLKWIEAKWKELQPDQPFVFTTLSGFNEQNYRFEEKFARVIIFFTFVVLLLSVSGLISLNLYIANLRTKEISIRKILGAGTHALLLNLSRRFVVIILLGFVLSVPLSWYALDAWLNGFAYKVTLTTGIFVTACAVTFILSMISIGIPSWRAAAGNVLNALKSAE